MMALTLDKLTYNFDSVKTPLDLKQWSRPMTIGSQKKPKPPTKAALLAALRSAVVYRSERGGRLVGRVCTLCDTRWKGRAERHQPFCVLAGSEELS